MKATLFFAPLLAILVACSSPPPEITASHDMPVAASPIIEAAPIAQLQKPAEVPADVLKNYKETTVNCREYEGNKPRGHYYRSGVLVRAVDDGAYNPWMYSPTAISIGGTS